MYLTLYIGVYKQVAISRVLYFQSVLSLVIIIYSLGSSGHYPGIAQRLVTWPTKFTSQRPLKKLLCFFSISYWFIISAIGNFSDSVSSFQTYTRCNKNRNIIYNIKENNVTLMMIYSSIHPGKWWPYIYTMSSFGTRLSDPLRY